MRAQGTAPPRLALASTNAPARPHGRNDALAALSSSAFSVLEPHLRQDDFVEGAVLWDAGEQIDRVYFPLSGVVSIVLRVREGSGVEVASVGHEGAAGMTLGSRQPQSATQGVVQIAGTFAHMSALQFASAARQNNEVNRFAAICCDWLLIQSQQISACTAVHSAEARFCRWLLQSSERIDGDVVPLTQDAIARALGIRRTTVTLIAQQLQMSQIIRYSRGRISISNRDGLGARACDCCVTFGRSNWPSQRLLAKQG